VPPSSWPAASAASAAVDFRAQRFANDRPYLVPRLASELAE
jgi:hypothetical protein